jgi:hypothetical protein
MDNSANQAINWFEPNTFTNVIGFSKEDGELTGLEKVRKILDSLDEDKNLIDKSLLEQYEIEMLEDI